MSHLYVKAAPGLKFPKEGAPRTYIEGTDPVAVEASHYYRKAITDGDLLPVPTEDWNAFQAATATADTAAVAAAAEAATMQADGDGDGSKKSKTPTKSA
jgi:hypothetical protein